MFPWPKNAIWLSADYDETKADGFFNVDASGGEVTVTIPAAASGDEYGIRKVDDSSNDVLLAESGGGELATLSERGVVKHAISNGSSYAIT